jgi:hypothetical protein
LAVSSVLALALLFARNRWALIVPSVYGAVEFLKIMVVWLIAQVSNAPAPPARLPLFPAFDLRPGPSPDLAILVLGAVLGIAASWGDFRAALRFVMKGDRERHEASE